MKRIIRSTRSNRSSDQQADLHVHSTYSDGAHTPCELVEMAADLGLCALGITDHDAIAGIPEGMERGSKLGVEVVPGVEISAGMNTHEVHILGYYIDPFHTELREQLARYQNVRVDRVRRMIEQLANLDIKIELDYVLDLGGEGAVGRPHVAKALVEYGYVGTMNEAFDLLIGDGKPGYVARHRVTPEDAIDLIHRAGGIACWAHPGLEKHDEWLDEFVSLGLDGIESVHPEHSPGEVMRYHALAAEHDLLITGGTDFHGGDGAGGPQMGQFTTDLIDLRRLREASEQMQSGT